MKIRSGVSIAVAALLTPALVSAAVNLLEPWKPGMDVSVIKPMAYQTAAGFRSGEHVWELPLTFTYGIAPKLEAGARWGIISESGSTGINDLQIGAKYRINENRTNNAPAVLVEAAASLPTGDSNHALGTGATALSAQWAAKFPVDEVNGFAGLGITLNAENSDHIRQGNVFFYRAGAEWPYRSDLTIIGELKGFNHGKGTFSGSEVDSDFQELYLAPGIATTIEGKYPLSAALLIGMTSHSHDLGLSITVSF